MTEEAIPLDDAMELVKCVFTRGDTRGVLRRLCVDNATFAMIRERIAEEELSEWLCAMRAFTGIPVEMDHDVAIGMVRVVWP